MGTFHEHTDPLHGITVVVDTDGPEIYVGRYDETDGREVVLRDGDVFREGEGDRSKVEYLAKAAEYGVWKTFERMAVATGRITSIKPLADFVHSSGSL